MLSPESLVRLRTVVLHSFLIATTGAGMLAIAALVTDESGLDLPRGFFTFATLAISCVSVLICLNYTRRKERTGPAVVGIVLTAAASAGALALIWSSFPSDTAVLLGVSFLDLAIAWTLLLAVMSERLAPRSAYLQLTSALMLGAAALFTLVTIWTGPESPFDQATSVLDVVGLTGALIVFGLGRLHRSGVRALVPMTHVASVLRSMDFYQQIGFRCENSFHPPQTPEPTWAWMEAPGGAQLMLACAEGPMAAAPQGVLFYVYCDDLPAKHAELAGKGLAVGPIEQPFYAPRGEFRLTDPDGYALMLTHT